MEETSIGRIISSTKDSLFRQVLLRLQRLKTERNSLSTSREAHACHPRFCSPESEAMMGVKDPISCNVFMCNYGCTHVCTEDLCTYYHAAPKNVCPISGYQFGQELSSYSKDDYRTRRNPLAEKVCDVLPLKKKQRRPSLYAPQLSEEEASNQATKLIHLLLYSPKRHALNLKAALRFRHQAEEAKQKYIRDQLSDRQLPYFTDMYRVVAHVIDHQELPLKEFEVDHNLVRYYVFVILQVWDILQRFHVHSSQKKFQGDLEIIPRLDFEAITLAVLYTMRKGLRRAHVQLLPGDDFLLLNLPIINSLIEFDLDKAQVTKGDKLISDAYDNAFLEGANMSEITLNMEKMPVPETSTIEKHQGALVKISSSGEKLFMPVVRRIT